MGFLNDLDHMLGLDKLQDKLEGGINNLLGRKSAADKRKEADAVNGQVQAYKNQSEISQQEIARVKGEQAVEKRRINEKQIRALRNRFRPAGLLGINQTNDQAGSGLKTKLGA